VVFTVSATVVTLASWKRFTFAIFSAFSVWPGLTSWLQTADSVHWSTRHTVSTALDRLRHQNARQSTHKTSDFTLNSQAGSYHRSDSETDSNKSSTSPISRLSSWKSLPLAVQHGENFVNCIQRQEDKLSAMTLASSYYWHSMCNLWKTCVSEFKLQNHPRVHQ